jgi:hypothetical protein
MSYLVRGEILIFLDICVLKRPKRFEEGEEKKKGEGRR